VRIVRDLRLDLFRGLALLLIFLDHIPSNVISWVTVRNYGFSDATEIFIFISGYANAYVYGAVIRRRGLIDAAAWILNRAWQIYLAQIFLFVVYIAEIAYLAGSSSYYTEEANLRIFLQQPDVAMLEALLLKFRPVNLDILPLYVILMLGFPPFLWLLARNPVAGLAASVALYALARSLDWNLPAYPEMSRATPIIAAIPNAIRSGCRSRSSPRIRTRGAPAEHKRACSRANRPKTPARPGRMIAGRSDEPSCPGGCLASAFHARRIFLDAPGAVSQLGTAQPGVALPSHPLYSGR